MKRIIYGLLLSAVALNAAGAFAQANTSLSNLVAPTAINASLLFDTDNAYTVGSSTDGASTVYTSNVSSTGVLNIITPDASGVTVPDITIQGGSSSSGLGGRVFIYGGNGASAGTGDIILNPGVTTSGTFYRSEVRLVGHVHFQEGGATTVSACGTSPSIAGGDGSGRINVGTTTSTCTVTFEVTWATTPICFINNETARVAVKVVPTTTSFTVSAAANFAAGTVLDYMCVAAN